MQEYDIFYYWDDVSGGGMPPYLKLCMETWHKNSKANQFHKVCLENVEFLTGGEIDKKTMSLFTPAQRSDAAMVLVMKNQRGIFLDVDTILLPSFNPDRYLSENIPSMYSVYRDDGIFPLLAFLANPNINDDFLLYWANKTLHKTKSEGASFYRRTRRFLRTIKGKQVHVKWDYLGAAILDPLARQKDVASDVLFLDMQNAGFCPYSDQPGYGPKLFHDFWFGERFIEIDYKHRHGIVALQNSWMPESFTSLSRNQIMMHQSKLSSTFRAALSTGN